MSLYMPHIATFLGLATINFFILFPIAGKGWLSLAPYILQAVILIGVFIGANPQRDKQIAVSGFLGGAIGFACAAWVFVRLLANLMNNF